MSDFDWIALIESMDAPISAEDRSRRIADVLATGTPSRTFCLMLAEMIRPGGKNTAQFALKLKRKGQGQPKGPNWWQIAFEMERLIDVEGLSEDEAVYLTQGKFGKKGNSKRKCQDALRAARAFTQSARICDGSSS